MGKLKNLIAAASVAALIFGGGIYAAEYQLLNVSYDPTRELYKEYNVAFSDYYKQKTGDLVKVNQSHGGSGTQARSVIDGSPADVVTLALAYDIDAIVEKSGKIKKDWENSFANHSAPYTSTIVFLVRKGNPKNIQNWDDLIRDDVKVITPNPKTSGGARWNHLAAYGYALKLHNNNATQAQEYLKKLYANVPVLDTGARGSTNTFVRRGLGDVLIAWENEAYLAIEKLGRGQFEIVTPKISILAETPVAIVDSVVESKGTRAVATAYLEYLYSKEAQEIIAKNYYRPTNEEVLKANTARFKELELFTIKDFGGWSVAQEEHFSDGGIFDKIFESIKTDK
ncbi:sulfate ABC transporter substrate-binding protein [Helicobacter turcicus]|uniref:Sulfate-binding protein n=1 Tax=Helicobacter turcicus TaxID=2867412 RepID=A0ABS7JKT6_9HELI|nr:sulfate ABC transporter substrate-binding protein [Helicobacter turcicus]MBX7489986.1 sulfate ABC transporter substrate-binding protein [Helicobacter turcicus]MBX7544845.1 sulfate ABC transporter substrate-binding protein [Helicobacter turcicus]